MKAHPGEEAPPMLGRPEGAGPKFDFATLRKQIGVDSGSVALKPAFLQLVTQSKVDELKRYYPTPLLQVCIFCHYLCYFNLCFMFLYFV